MNVVDQHLALTEPSDPGDAGTQFELGLRLFNGNGCEPEPGRSACLFRKAAEQGHAQAQFILGLMHLFCDDVENEAERVFAHGALSLDLKMSEQGLGWVGPDRVKAVEWLCKAADQGFVQAQHMLAIMYHRGIGLKHDDQKAVARLRKTAELGLPYAQYYLGRNFLEGKWGLARDLEKAVYWLEKAADQGETKAQYKLAWLLEEGQGVEPDSARATGLFRQAAEGGYRRAGYILSVKSRFVDDGVEVHDQKGVGWLQKAAEAGCDFAQYHLGVMYRDGLHGLERDEQKALEWLRQAAARYAKARQAYLSLLSSGKN